MSYYVENAWWASPFNDKPEIKKTYWPGQKVTIHDATLRDGEQTPGVSFHRREKIEIARTLEQMGD